MFNKENLLRIKSDKPEIKKFIKACHYRNPQFGTPLMKASAGLRLDLTQKILLWQDGYGAVKISNNTGEFLQSWNKVPKREVLLEKMPSAIEVLGVKQAGFSLIKLFLRINSFNHTHNNEKLL